MSPDRSEQTVITYGDEAVNEPIESVLDDSAAAYPTQSKKKGKSRKGGKLLVIIANGYTGYGSVEKEIEDIKNNLWFPHTEDFKATASFTRNKRYYGASSAPEFFGALAQGPPRISRVVFIGHGSADTLGLSGRPHDLFQNTLDTSDIEAFQGTINTKIKHKFTQNAKMDLVSCNTAVGLSFSKALATALGICVRGFKEEVDWCVSHNNQRITGRGLIGRETVARGKPCSDKVWTRGVHNFIPPEETCP